MVVRQRRVCTRERRQGTSVWWTIHSDASVIAPHVIKHLGSGIFAVLHFLACCTGKCLSAPSYTTTDHIGVNFCKAARLELPLFKLKGFQASESLSPHFCHMQSLWSCLLWCTKQETTPDDIHDNQTISLPLLLDVQSSESFQLQGERKPPDPLTRGSAPGPRCRSAPDPIIGSRFALAVVMAPPLFYPSLRLCYWPKQLALHVVVSIGLRIFLTSKLANSQHCNAFFTSGFVDNVTFAHNISQD